MLERYIYYVFAKFKHYSLSQCKMSISKCKLVFIKLAYHMHYAIKIMEQLNYFDFINLKF